MLAVIRAAPGVQAAAGADSLPMIGIVNRPMYGAAMGTQRCPATGGFMETLGMRIIAGRSLSSEDVERGTPVGVLSLAGLEFVWPEVTPDAAVGRVLQFLASRRARWSAWLRAAGIGRSSSRRAGCSIASSGGASTSCTSCGPSDCFGEAG
jgi:hypothetical protein